MKEKRKNDPRLVSTAREVRDWWLEQVNAVALVEEGKYDVSRAIEGRGAEDVTAMPMRQLAA